MARTGMFATLAALALASVAEAQMMAPPMYGTGTSGRTGLFGGLRARRNQQVTYATPGTFYQQPMAGGFQGPTTGTPVVSGTTPVIYGTGTTPVVYAGGTTTPIIYRGTGTPIVYAGGTTTPIIYGTPTTGPIVYGPPTTGPITGGVVVGGTGTTPGTVVFNPMTTVPGPYAGAMTGAPTYQPAGTPGYGTYRARLLRRGGMRNTNPIAAAPYSGGSYYR